LLAVSGSTEMARLRRSGCGAKRFEEHRDFAPNGAWGVFWADGFYKDFAPYGAWGVGDLEPKKSRQTGLGVLFGRTRSTECRTNPPNRAPEVRHLCSRTRHAPQSSVRSGIVEGLGCLLAMSVSTEISPLTGLGVLLAVSGSTEMARLRRSGCGTKRFEEHRDFAPNGAWGVVGRVGFYRDGAPTALGLWGETV
jgi:hypothetical protein